MYQIANKAGFINIVSPWDTFKDDFQIIVGTNNLTLAGNYEMLRLKQPV